MAGAKLEKTQHSGIFKRHGDRGVRYGKQRRETARTLADARALKRRREGGETHAAGRIMFAGYARDWLGRHPVRESTRADYDRHLERWIIPFIGEKRKLADVSPLLMNQLVGHLRVADGHRTLPDGTRAKLSDSTIE